MRYAFYALEADKLNRLLRIYRRLCKNYKMLINSKACVCMKILIGRELNTLLNYFDLWELICPCRIYNEIFINYIQKKGWKTQHVLKEAISFFLFVPIVHCSAIHVLNRHTVVVKQIQKVVLTVQVSLLLVNNFAFCLFGLYYQ